MLKILNRKTDLLFHENWDFLQKYQLFVRCRSFLLGAVFLLILLIGKNQILTILIKKIFFDQILIGKNQILTILIKKIFFGGHLPYTSILTLNFYWELAKIIWSKKSIIDHWYIDTLMSYPCYLFLFSLLARIFLPFLCFCCRIVEQSFQTLSCISFFFSPRQLWLFQVRIVLLHKMDMYCDLFFWIWTRTSPQIK